MLCPYCNTDMEEGFLSSIPRARLFWGPEEANYYSDTSFDVSETKPQLLSMEENRLTTHYCPCCDLLLAYRPNREKVTLSYWTGKVKTSTKRLIKKLKKEDF